ncbi:N-terminal nucleophile aminohydrolase [Sodiomyces alkalinus F11]|uniref:N-terminal nucleophile aminohydrolase n=1 Tax=Sodiomyces alkalinus (strain CBS 110278 / VKM F-3762 / F11) TaxID=1314773 RepID=A0A3N2QB40_SODAK|nr:N-terminal nucleophile aminohydrolase [Sodiomyces alkalinus F11]ROT43825.1 N-terminal nucleophile aminohydrolase [Sodiomyces alkalinus F11]
MLPASHHVVSHIKMEYKPQAAPGPRIKPRLIIHGGAGNITPANLPPAQYRQYRASLLSIVCKANAYMTTPIQPDSQSPRSSSNIQPQPPRLPSALETAAYAVTLLEDDPLYNSGRGAVFTRDGVIELEASVMVSRGRAKRCVGVSGIRTVRNPILLAKAMLEHGDQDLRPHGSGIVEGEGDKRNRGEGIGGEQPTPPPPPPPPPLDIPSAQGHTHLHGVELTATLAERYGLALVDDKYFFTDRRWQEHRRALEREKAEEGGRGRGVAATWSADEYLPQGTCGAVALDEDGVVCVATSTGGLTNKLTGRIGDTPTVGAGFWAGEWDDDEPIKETMSGRGGEMGRDWMHHTSLGAVALGGALRWFLADCLPSPWTPWTSYGPVPSPQITSTRSFGASGTGNGDSFLRTAAVRSVAARAQWKPEPSAQALTAVTGPAGELQRSAEDRWGTTGEGQGGMIGIESTVLRDAHGDIVGAASEVLQDFNCGGMFRAWIDDDGRARARIWRDGEVSEPSIRQLEEAVEEVTDWVSNKSWANREDHHFISCSVLVHQQPSWRLERKCLRRRRLFFRVGNVRSFGQHFS